MEQFQLLRSKLYRPRVTGDLIRRPRALAMLDRLLDRPITLVCAPAGFGKTTLLSDWVDTRPNRCAWLSLDEQDSSLDRFLAYIVAAVRTVFPSACADTLALLRGPVLPPLGALVTALVNDLDGLPDDRNGAAQGEPFILVLDDYHLVRDQDVHRLLGSLLEHPPLGLHLVISTRLDPPFALHALRAHGDLGEIRTPDLRFARDEIAAFMERALEVPLDPNALADLTERSEGWVTALRLAVLTLNAGGEVSGAPLEAAADNRYVLEYLLNEVLARVPLATQEFLLKTSILKHLSGPLCDAVTGWDGPDWDGDGYLEWLAQENLFTFAVDAHGTWYRYHHLFRSLLRKRLERQHSAQEIAELHRRASAWLAQTGLVEEAIEHALAAGDEMMVVRLVEANRHKAMNQENWRQARLWLSLVPRQLIESRPELLMLDAWMLQQQWRIADLPVCLDRIEALMGKASAAGTLPEADQARLSSEIDCLRSCVSYYVSDVERTRIYAERALRTAPLDCSFVRAYAWYYVAAARQMTGDIQGTLDAFNDGLIEDRLHANAFPSRLYVGLCMLHWMRGDLPNLLLTASQMLQLSRQRGLAEAESWGHYHQGCAFYQMNRLEEAAAEFAEAFSQPYVAHDFAFSQSGFGLAAVYMARGEFDRAGEIVRAVAAHALKTVNGRLMADVESFRAWLDVRTGALAVAEHWAAGYNLDGPGVPMTTFHVARLALARALIGIGTPARLSQAEQALKLLHAAATATHNTRCLVEVLALQALLQDARGDSTGAVRALREAVRCAESGRLIRVFVDLGPRMETLLAKLGSRTTGSSYLRELLAAFDTEQELQTALSYALPEQAIDQQVVARQTPAREASVNRVTGDNGYRSNGHSSQEPLIEPLSRRELEVLELMGEWMTNKEIGRKLSISPQTAKRHTVNIYQKLGVNSRREAVAQGAALGLLDSPTPPGWRSLSREA